MIVCAPYERMHSAACCILQCVSITVCLHKTQEKKGGFGAMFRLARWSEMRRVCCQALLAVLLSSGSLAVTSDACRLIINRGKHNYIAFEINERIDRPL